MPLGAHFRQILNFLRDSVLPTLACCTVEALRKEARYYQMDTLIAVLVDIGESLESKGLELPRNESNLSRLAARKLDKRKKKKSISNSYASPPCNFCQCYRYDTYNCLSCGKFYCSIKVFTLQKVVVSTVWKTKFMVSISKIHLNYKGENGRTKSSKRNERSQTGLGNCKITLRITV